MKKFFCRFFLNIIYFVIILFVFKIIRAPEKFENYLFYKDFQIQAYLLLILYRFLIYFGFPIIFSLLDLIKNKEKFIVAISYNFNVSFFTYFFLNSCYLFFGLDKVLNVNTFNTSDAMLFIATFIINTIIGKGIPNIFENNNNDDNEKEK